ncbi:RnfABCDGE type electron transport complex subunit D [Borrelia puertoricensis]|uniref:RnfABCDGE type electron transport complex subunit D n=1 Tax=Borrelia puertoricensis TaxID=2756107 RepID=UPI001FF1C3ED|nr:RnfABCDGE type electron transport complex subunit D [Borrelia puertoricensis]UPA17605.1 RnfABCDGE type electron transport complex subunit D [Borrelia puertoricensis]
MSNSKKLKIKKQYKVNIDEIQMPECVLIPLETENAKSTIYIIENQRITEGQILSKNKNAELYTYSPISGTIEKIYTANLPGEHQLKSALIRFHGRIKNEQELSVEEESREKTLEKLIRLGIPWFNEHSLFQYVSKCKKIDKMLFLINGKDPFTNISEILIKEKLDEIIYGFKTIDKIFKFKEILIVLSNYHLKKELANLNIFQDKRLTIKLIPNTSYPYSNHEVIMHFLYNEESIKNNINPNKNILLANVEDLYNVYRTLKTNSPYKEKFITINGNKKIQSKLIKVKIGTSIQQIINEDIDTKKYDIFINNPANKIKINNLNIPITRDIYSITILKKESILSKIKFLKTPSFSPLYMEGIILSKIKGKNNISNKQLQYLQYTETETEDEINKVKKEIKEKILNLSLNNEPIYTENNLKDIYLTIILALIPSLIFSFTNNIKFLIDTLILTMISLCSYIPIMLKSKHKYLSFFIYTSLIINIILPLNFPIILKIMTLLFTFLVFFYFSKLSKFLVNPILISFMFLLLNFPSSFKNTYSKKLSEQEDIIPTWNKIMQKSSNTQNLESLKEFKRYENKHIDMIEKFINDNILSNLNIMIPRFHVENLLGLQNEKYLSPILIYIGFSFILEKFIINKLIPLSFYVSLLLIAYILKSLGLYSYISFDMLTLIISPIPMILVFTMSTELQIAPPFKFEQILYGITLSLAYFITLSYIPLETLAAVISIFILQISSTLIKKYSLTFQIKKILHHLSMNQAKTIKYKNENGEEII